MRVSAHDICDDAHASGHASACNKARMSGPASACDDTRVSGAEQPTMLAVILVRVGPLHAARWQLDHDPVGPSF